jgi:hypothetical protein
MDMSMDMPMDTPAVDASQHHRVGPSPGKFGTFSHRAYGTCPYGASPAFALPALMDVPGSVHVSATSLILSPQVAHFETVPRAQSPRGPPLEV